MRTPRGRRDPRAGAVPASPAASPALPSREALAAFVRASGETDLAQAAAHFAVK
ncbi:MAG: hypothetical protein INR64_07555, partial [Caulobacteraceae bacterium]|nr:hypothetical protein [Caulobacter sp.]